MGLALYGALAVADEAAAGAAVATTQGPATVAAQVVGPSGEGTPALELELGRPAGARASDVIVRVFLEEPAADAGTPPTSPGFVASVTFFGAGAAGAGEGGDGQRFLLPLDDTIARLARAGRSDPLGGKPEVTVVLVPIREGAAVGGASVAVKEATINWR